MTSPNSPGGGPGGGGSMAQMNLDDLSSLPELTDRTILDALESRYKRDLIYTYIGDILLSVNPYKVLPIYGTEGKLCGTSSEWRNPALDMLAKLHPRFDPVVIDKSLHYLTINFQETIQYIERYSKTPGPIRLPPHVFAVANRAYTQLRATRTNQCCVVSGESGAGKTEATKLMVRHIVHQCNEQHTDLHEKIIQVNPLLEAFGNAQTLVNNNSSRFGKFIELSFTQNGSIFGARLSEYLLEKSRVVSHGREERNFHIFYILFAGLSDRELHRLLLERPETYRIVQNGREAVFRSEPDFFCYRDMHNRLCDIMKLVGFSQEDVHIIFALLAAILHITNIQFIPEPEFDGVYIENEYELDIASNLLGVDMEALASVLISNVTIVRNEKIVSMKSMAQANDGRDALAKAIYSRLFSWIVQQINGMLYQNQDQTADIRDHRTIGILDIAGFENFPINSFEQLCINVANEQLQYYFNQHIFAWELQTYHTEGLKPMKIKFTNNKPVLDMFLERPMGLFSLLDEESRLQRTTDFTMVEKCNKHLSKSDHYRKSKHKDTAFTIIHYAGEVMYRAEGFLEKNRDTVSTNLVELLQKSASWIVFELFSARINETGVLQLSPDIKKRSRNSILECKTTSKKYTESMSRKAGKKLKQKMKENKHVGDIPPPSQVTASLQFRNSLTDLLEKLLNAEPQFIRCLKPNSTKDSDRIDPELVHNQLRYTGVLETVRIRRSGYPSRLPFDTFLKRYGEIAYPYLAKVEATQESCLKVLQKCDLHKWLMGKHKVFLKYWHIDLLNSHLETIYKRVMILQNFARRYLALRVCRRLEKLKREENVTVHEFCGSVEQLNSHSLMMQMSGAQHDVVKHQEQILQQRLPQPMTNWRLPGMVKSTDTALPKPKHMPANRPGHDGAESTVFGGRRMLPQGVKSVHLKEIRQNMGRRTAEYHNTKEFYQSVIREVVNKREKLDSDIWCKIIYMEKNIPVAKFYICERTLLVNSSSEPFNGGRIGLGFFTNSLRDEASTRTRSYIRQGISVSMDAKGNIIATRHTHADVIVRGHHDPANNCFSQDLVLASGRLPLGKPIVIFDMNELKSQMALELKKSSYDVARLQQLCVVCLSFLTEAPEDLLETPCFLCFCYFPALEAINNPQVIREVQNFMVKMALKDENENEYSSPDNTKQVLSGEDEEIAAVLKLLSNSLKDENYSDDLITDGDMNDEESRKWAKANQRMSFGNFEAPLRLSQNAIRQQNRHIGDHMMNGDPRSNLSSPNTSSDTLQDYSYQNTEEIHSNASQFLANHMSDRPRSPTVISDSSAVPRIQWAKMKIFEKTKHFEDEKFRNARPAVRQAHRVS